MESSTFFEAIEKGDVEQVKELLDRQPELLRAKTSPNYAPQRQPDCTALHAAIYARRPEVARVLVDAGIDIEARTNEGRTALHDSIEFGVGMVTDLLLERGAELDICSAAILGRIERVRELLDEDPALVNDRSTQLSPLGWASFGNQIETARELIERGARMDDGELLCAASVGHVEVGRLLIERGAQPDEIRSDSGCNALHAAAAMKYAHDSTPFVDLLLHAGADVNLPTKTGQTALQIAESKARQQELTVANDPDAQPKSFRAVVALLLEHGAK